MKRLFVVGLSAVVATSLSACSPQPKDVSTGGSNTVQAQSTTSVKQNVKKFKVNFSKDFKYIKLNVNEVAIKPDQIEVGINYKNTANQKITWYPDQDGQLAVGDMQLSVDPLTQTSLVTGDILPGTKADGVLVFKPAGDKKIDVNKVKSIRFNLGETISEDMMNSEKIDFEIPVK